jgi:subtilisin family serine protease
MKNLVLFLLLAISLPAFGQIEVPKEARKQYREAVDNYKDQKKQGYDIILDPGEQTPVDQSTKKDLVQYVGNWGSEYLGINELLAQISTRAKRRVLVYIFDTAGKYTHPDLQQAAWNDKGRVYTSESAPEDGNGHSTHCAGIIGATTSGVPIGIARALVQNDLLKIIPIKVLTNQGAGQFDWVANAVKDVNIEAKQFIAQGYAIVYSFSLGGLIPGGYPPLDEQFKIAKDAGIFIAAAAGNTGSDGVNYPGSSVYANAVAALERINDTNAQRASYSTMGDQVFCAAPGSQVLSTYPPNLLRELSGTSMATPHAAAVAAILLSIYPNATGNDIAAHIAKFSTDLPPSGRDKFTGFGAVLLKRLLDNQPGGNPTPPNPPTPPPGVDPVLPGERVHFIGMPRGDVFYQIWKTKGQLNSQKLKVSIPRIEAISKLYAEDVYDKVQVALNKYYQSTMIILADTDDYVTATRASARFLELNLNTTLLSVGIRIAVKEIAGEDVRARISNLVINTSASEFEVDKSATIVKMPAKWVKWFAKKRHK